MNLWLIIIALSLLSLFIAVVYAYSTKRSGYPPDQTQIHKLLQPGIKAIFDQQFKDLPSADAIYKSGYRFEFSKDKINITEDKLASFPFDESGDDKQ